MLPLNRLTGADCFGWAEVLPRDEIGTKNLSKNPEGVIEDFLGTRSVNLIGYIPILGIATGILRLQAIGSEDTLSWRVMQIIRATGEILCCGPLFIVVDLIVSIIRLCIPKTLPPHEVESELAPPFKLVWTDTFGCHRPICKWSAVEKNPTKARDYEINLDLTVFTSTCNFYGYFPGISILSGLRRLIEIDEDLGSRSWRIMQYTRGIIEIIGLGSIFIIADIIATIARAFFWAESNDEEESVPAVEPKKAVKPKKLVPQGAISKDISSPPPASVSSPLQTTTTEKPGPFANTASRMETMKKHRPQASSSPVGGGNLAESPKAASPRKTSRKQPAIHAL